ncbi:MAG: hypothetical protein Q4A31_06140 [Corynebacterium sp.]|uniref:hypothetical protein n=1 Tax=Corynebacterium sp. TaxID=1720 RepID=UPI0026DC1517|nr:hypothetical protein [Corynebacterium sp.]MDO4761479.1 hypothetical protein [Corynebacterium sp.]
MTDNTPEKKPNEWKNITPGKLVLAVIVFVVAFYIAYQFGEAIVHAILGEPEYQF